ncbi:MAG: hypothetical protein DHS20C01_14740 [marine bacterium B5-7]|nr:MAG: hypothetical protein DHS20C01_14740 [marine bacterium B5-7]
MSLDSGSLPHVSNIDKAEVYMETIKDKMTDDHRHCDEMFAEAEDLVTRDDWTNAIKRFDEFAKAMDHHFNMEEEVLFPQFEQATGITAGPTEVMRSEHSQMRLLIEAMDDAVHRSDSDEYLGQSETLLIIMQQHNTKEEGMLYPMVDESIGDNVEQLLSSLNDI